jgi:hypothetical protein
MTEKVWFGDSLRDKNIVKYLTNLYDKKKKFVPQHEMVCCVSCGAEPTGSTGIAVVTHSRDDASSRIRSCFGLPARLPCASESKGKEKKGNGKALDTWMDLDFLLLLLGPV